MFITCSGLKPQLQLLILDNERLIGLNDRIIIIVVVENHSWV